MQEFIKMKISMILGSARRNNPTEMAYRIALKELQQFKSVEVVEIIPSELKLSVPGVESEKLDQEWLQQMVKNTEGVIIVTPEYHGGFSSLIKLVIENLGYPSALSGKAVSLIGVAGGQMGAVKSLEQLRSVCFHVGALVLPGSVSIPMSRFVFDEDGNCLDAEIGMLIKDCISRLVQFVQDMKSPEISTEDMSKSDTK